MPQQNSLVLYKTRPARVRDISDKIEIELDGAKVKRVRPKDIVVLHPGPLPSLQELTDPEGDVETAWALLEGEESDVAELAELAFGDYTPRTAWAAWRLLEDGLYFEGTPTQLRARSREAVERERARRENAAAEAAAWNGFVSRIEKGTMEAGDREWLEEVERLALGRIEYSRVLKNLGYQESPQSAHRLLVKVGYWPGWHNPYPGRAGLPLDEPRQEVPSLPREERMDLTRLDAFAIDDAGNEDPDDAISLDGDRLWVHVADVAALVPPDSAMDLEARARGANLYIPEATVPMLPSAVTCRLGLGLTDESPALSIGFRIEEDGSLADIEITPSRVQVSRLTYTQAEAQLHEPSLARLAAVMQRYHDRRRRAGAVSIDLPEARVRARAGEVVITPFQRLASRQMVTDAMLAAGEAAALFCQQNDISVPYATQPAPAELQTPEGMAAMYAYRRQLKPSRLVVEPGPHFGLGLASYLRATSPLRRYSDLLVHQQLRACLAGGTLLDEAEVGIRIDMATTSAAAIRRTERLSNTHWKLVYLRMNRRWRGQGIVVERHEGPRVTVLIPDLAMEARIRLSREAELDAQVAIGVREVDVPELTAYFQQI